MRTSNMVCRYALKRTNTEAERAIATDKPRDASTIIGWISAWVPLNTCAQKCLIFSA